MTYSILTRSLVTMVAALALAACSSAPKDSSETDANYPTSQNQEEYVQTGTVDQGEATEVSEPVTADNFWNNPSNYDGTVNSRVIYFAFDRSEIPPAALITLRAHADYLKSHANAKVRLEGNTDERGTREYNIALGERRAKTVQQFLRVQGVSSSQIEIVSYGEEKPAATGHDAMSWAKNRRAVINYRAGEP